MYLRFQIYYNSYYRKGYVKMNIKLSIYENRKKALQGFLIEKNGEIVDYKVRNSKSTNSKKLILESLYEGLKSAKFQVKHDDVLVIEVQNSYVAQWVSGSKYANGFEAELDRVMNILESIDCQYRVIFNRIPRANLVVSEGIDSFSGAFSVEDTMNGFD